MLEQQPVPITKMELPKMKMKNITTKYPSMPQMRNSCGTGSGGGGLGHDEAQSTQEQADLIPFKKEESKLNTRWRKFSSRNLHQQIHCKEQLWDPSA